MQTRMADPDDASAIVRFLQIAYGQSDYLLLEVGEFNTTAEEQRQQMISRSKNNTGVMFLCENDADVIGLIFGLRSAFKRNRHSLYLVLAVLKQRQRQGIGFLLMERIEEWARANAVSRLELTVDVRNEAAISLYDKVGFSVEGRRRRSRRLGDQFIDELSMAKLL